MLQDFLSDIARGLPQWLLHRGLDKLVYRHPLLFVVLVALVTPVVVLGYALITGVSTFAILALTAVLAVFVLYGYTLIAGRTR